MSRLVCVTGGYGFIGAYFVNNWLARHPWDKVLIIDCETYAAEPKNISAHAVVHEKIDIRDQSAVNRVFQKYKPDVLFHFAAESHVCRSITGPKDFMTTNILGTWNLLEEWRQLHWANSEKKFIHISTDEVFGELRLEEPDFNELSAIKPRSPYASSKASSDLIALSYNHTYGIPVIVTNCSNNFGPYQHEEKLIPATIKRMIENKPVRLYGDGLQRRDWLYVGDHCEALIRLEQDGNVGERYCIGGLNEMSNIEVCEEICDVMDEIGRHYKFRFELVNERPTDDRRYSIDPKKLARLGWLPTGPEFRKKLTRTVEWYLNKWGHLWNEQR